MSLSYNRLIIAGHLTRDPEVRILAGDRSVAKFGVAQSSRWKAADGTQREDTVFIDVECWGRTADLVGKYFAKGAAVFCEGKLKLDSWQDKDGLKRTRLFMVADDVRFVESKRDGQEPAAARPSRPAPTTPPPAAAECEPPF